MSCPTPLCVRKKQRNQLLWEKVWSKRIKSEWGIQVLMGREDIDIKSSVRPTAAGTRSSQSFIPTVTFFLTAGTSWLLIVLQIRFTILGCVQSLFSRYICLPLWLEMFWHWRGGWASNRKPVCSAVRWNLFLFDVSQSWCSSSPTSPWKRFLFSRV